MSTVSVKDRCTEKPQKHLGWKKVNNNFLGFPWEHDRVLKVSHAQEAVNKIDAQVRVFPFQLRYAMARPLWYRYANMYCETGDQDKAMAEI